MRATPLVACIAVLGVLLPATPAFAAGKCFGRTPTIVGTPGNDKIYGTAGNDVIVGRGGNDVIHGRRGHDRICTGGGRDRIQGARGNDRIFGWEYIDTLHGGRGHDLLISKLSDIFELGYPESLYGGPGNDTLVGGAGPDRLLGGPGNDTIRGNGNQDDAIPEFLIGEEGDDVLSIDGQDRYRNYYLANFAGGPGDDVMSAGRHAGTLDYSRSSTPVDVDVTTGRATGEGADTFEGMKHVYGSVFDDTIVGGDGYNRLQGGPGNDRIESGAGTDEIFGQWIDWTTYHLMGGPDTDEDGHDILSGGDGDDYLRGHAGNDILDGGPGEDDLDGGDGIDSCMNGETLVRCE